MSVDDHLLCFLINPQTRTVTFQLPTHPWQIRDIQSAGSYRLRLSGLQSRHHTLYSYPPHMAELTSPALVQLYVTKGHSKEHCAAALRPSRKRSLYAPLLCAVSASCVCQLPFQGTLTYSIPFILTGRLLDCTVAGGHGVRSGTMSN